MHVMTTTTILLLMGENMGNGEGVGGETSDRSIGVNGGYWWDVGGVGMKI